MIVFSLSFITSLSGALMPGPLFTYTVARTLGTERRGWLTGARVIAGHAVIEVLLLCGLVLGAVEFLRAPLAARIIGVAGGGLLLSMGASLIRETIRGKGVDLSEQTGQARQPGRWPLLLAFFLGHELGDLG